MNEALRALLEHIVDYAGMFPPAALDLDAAAGNYAAYRQSPDHWMLGRFVIAAARVQELRDWLAANCQNGAWPVSIVAPDARQAGDVIEFDGGSCLRVESVETKVSDISEIAGLASRAGSIELYVEVPLADRLDEWLDAVRGAGVRAKVRTGGTTVEAFPSPTDVLRFIRGCAKRDLAFKATAGLHHPLRGSYRLTYAQGAPLGTMLGFLNVFLTALLVREGIDDDAALSLLSETGSSAIAIDGDAIAWRNRRIGAKEVAAGRMRFATSFGSCSFREPVDELPWVEARV